MKTCYVWDVEQSTKGYFYICFYDFKLCKMHPFDLNALSSFTTVINCMSHGTLELPLSNKEQLP